MRVGVGRDLHLDPDPDPDASSGKSGPRSCSSAHTVCLRTNIGRRAPSAFASLLEARAAARLASPHPIRPNQRLMLPPPLPLRLRRRQAGGPVWPGPRVLHGRDAASRDHVRPDQLLGAARGQVRRVQVRTGVQQGSTASTGVCGSPGQGGCFVVVVVVVVAAVQVEECQAAAWALLGGGAGGLPLASSCTLCICLPG